MSINLLCGLKLKIIFNILIYNQIYQHPLPKCWNFRTTPGFGTDLGSLITDDDKLATKIRQHNPKKTFVEHMTNKAQHS